MIDEQEHHHEIAAKAADAAVRKVFAICGVDIDNPKEVSEFQASLRFTQSMHKAASTGGLAILGTLGTTLFMWIKSRLFPGA